MATTTTNLSLKKPALDDDALIADINNNMDTLDSTIGAPSSASGVTGNDAFSKINTLNGKINSNANSTNDILADALNCTESKFFNGSGGSYTGTVPSTNYKWATFMVNVKGTIKYVIAHAPENKIAINTYDNGAWQGWQELALNSSITFSNATSSITKNSTYVGTTNTKVFKSQNMAIVSINFQLSSNAPVNTELFTGLPTFSSSNGQMYGSIAKGDGTSIRIRVKSTGALDNEESMTTGWYNGNMCYPL